jgi:hypothetical protein
MSSAQPRTMQIDGCFDVGGKSGNGSCNVHCAPQPRSTNDRRRKTAAAMCEFLGCKRNPGFHFGCKRNPGFHFGCKRNLGFHRVFPFAVVDGSQAIRRIQCYRTIQPVQVSDLCPPQEVSVSRTWPTWCQRAVSASDGSGANLCPAPCARTIVGIAGEDDLKAPDLITSTTAVTSTGNGA